MILLKPTTEAQNLYFIKRPFITDSSNVSQLIQITDDITNNDLTYSVGTATEGDYTRLVMNITGLKEGRFYSLAVFDKPAGGGDNTCVYKDKIFVTDQDIDQVDNKNYTINDGEFVENTTENNDYIVI
ncbi:MAG: hypothetical protein GOVbin2014_42 [Prokaryotic dsDNA virus sp.]|nr:MAG: hypothetical protein GOVbin2014_42 [Prokaryotic dsDNA virus sp.]|tara:strand:+ start:26393 stop:26776 length:384 start_codon:yes stop_codon:yes gene_type:complete